MCLCGFVLEVNSHNVCVILQSHQVRDAQPGVAPQVSSRMTRRVRGRGPGKKVDPGDVAHRGSTVLMPGKSRQLNSVQ